jgi:PAS domain S-box-containing protein
LAASSQLTEIGTMLSAIRDEAVHLSDGAEPFKLFAGNDHGVFRAAIETSPAGTVVCDGASIILFCNRRAEAMFGYAPGALIGCSADRLIPETPSFAQLDAHFGDSRIVHGRRRDGSDVRVEMALTSISRNGRRLVIVSLIEAAQPPQVAPPAAPTPRPRVALIEDRAALRRPASPIAPGKVIAESAAALQALTQIAHVAPTNATVLLTGETGSGKEVFAQAIHDLNSRNRRPMVRVNCGAIPGGLLESELFGHERGAFTGALTQQIGRFEQAHGSTIFLDEIGEMPLEGQVKLLRVLQSKEVERLGGNRSVKVDVRIIAATNRDLERAVESREFRADLYYRLNIFPVHVPPLRERVEDIPSLVWSFVDDIAASCGKRIDSISQESMAALQRYSWPGNVRELRNVIERAVIVAGGPHLTVEAPRPANGGRPSTLRLDEVEIDHIRTVLDKTSWRIRGAAGAADLLGMKPTTLESRMAKLGIRRSA